MQNMTACSQGWAGPHERALVLGCSALRLFSVQHVFTEMYEYLINESWSLEKFNNCTAVQRQLLHC